jgi:hypothetical protein
MWMSRHKFSIFARFIIIHQFKRADSWVGSQQVVPMESSTLIMLCIIAQMFFSAGDEVACGKRNVDVAKPEWAPEGRAAMRPIVKGEISGHHEFPWVAAIRVSSLAYCAATFARPVCIYSEYSTVSNRPVSRRSSVHLHHIFH